MKKYLVKGMALLLAVCISLPVLSVSASASLSNPGFVYDPQPSGFNIFSNGLYDTIEHIYGPVASFFDVVNTISLPNVGSTSMGGLLATKEYYNNNFAGILARLIGPNLNDSWFSRAEITYDVKNGIYRLFDVWCEEWITDVYGEYPYVEASGDVPSTIVDPTAPLENKWLDVKNLDLNKVSLDFLVESEFSEALHNLKVSGVDCTPVKASFLGTDYLVVMKQAGTSAAYYCNPSGQPYVMMAQPSVTTNPFNYIVGENVVTQGTQILDSLDNIFSLIDDLGNSIPFELGDLSFDPSSGSYTANVYNTIDVGGITVNNYYTYNVTYNITNTYITYIGSNDAYDREEYEYYYQLPDGRSSADLTADEVAGMSFEFYDVVNYKKSATDVSVRALYHFDGNTDDSSYFSTQGSFDWGEGASITYMEAPSAFDGALYLDNTAHNFVVALPSNIGSGDFQVQFRHYQASEPDSLSNVENKLTFGDVVLSWDESSLYLNGTSVSVLPIGTWHEIGLARYNGHVYAYLNGLLVGSVSSTSYSFSFMTFEFGSTSRAYTMLDELRVLNVCLFKGAGSYSPSVVPFDSNLVLVLPDERLPIADSYMQVTPDPNAVAFWDWSSLSFGSSISDDFAVYGSAYNGRFTSGKWNYSSGDVVSASGGVAIDTGDFYKPSASDFTVFMTTGVALPMSGLLSNNTDYTVTVVLTDGTSLSHTFNTKTIYLNNVEDYEAVFNSLWATHSSNDVLKISTGLIRSGRNPNGFKHVRTSAIFLTPAVSGGSFDISHVEIVQGTKTDLKIEEITSVFSGVDLHPNTAAVQSAIPVNGYTVGGVRPTLPSRGDCWFPISDKRIQTCYIYTGAMWEEVGCRWFTGSRWIPIYAFDINTLQDLFDVADGSSAVPPLTSDSAFIRWWQLQWLDFRASLDAKFDELISAIRGGSPGSGSGVVNPDVGSEGVGFSEFLDSILSAVVDIASTVLQEFVGLIADLIKMFVQAVMDFVGGFVGLLADGVGYIGSLGEAVSPIGEFVRGTYDAIPDDIETVLTGSFIVVVVVSVISFLL